MSWRRFVICCWLLLCGPVLAHKASDSYLKIDVQGAQVSGQWDIALRPSGERWAVANDASEVAPLVER